MPDIYIGLIIGALAVNAVWLLARILRKHKSDGRLVLDMSGDGPPVALDISQFKGLMTAKYVTLDLEVILPEEEKDERTDAKNSHAAEELWRPHRSIADTSFRW